MQRFRWGDPTLSKPPRSRLWQTYGESYATVRWGRWRIFFMACAELFGYDNGEQWQVSHYLFERPA